LLDSADHHGWVMGKNGRDHKQSDEHNARGIDLADRGWLDEAMSEFKKAINLDPGSAHAHDNLGTVLAEKGDLCEALVEYIRAVQAEPNSPAVHHYLGSFLSSQAYELALGSYRKAIELDYEFTDSHLNLALALSERGFLEEAVVELEIAHAQEPDDVMIQHELACCLIDLEKYPEAIGHLKQVLKRSPDSIETHVDLGLAYTAQGFYAQAEEILLESLAKDEYDFATRYHLAALYAVWDKSDKALHHLEIAASRDQERFFAMIREDRLFDSLRHDERLLTLLR
jgi:tetratricopeptide (TPR) repeat protein